LAPVFAKLDHLDIEALGPASQAEPVAAGSPPVERVRGEAEALRAEWLSEKMSITEMEEIKLPNERGYVFAR
jgi:hypothetical protein